MVVDTSALLAILLDEPERRRFNELIEADPRRLVSVATVLEASIVLESRSGEPAGRELDLFLHRAKMEVTPVDGDQVEIARAAFRRFGEGRHPAGLNFGDCFAYALATVSGEPLLFKGADFGQTDVAVADRIAGIELAPAKLPVHSSVLGVDVGWSERRKATAVCLMEWDEATIQLKLRRFNLKDVRRELEVFLGSKTCLSAAVDGPLAPGFTKIGAYREAERALTRGLQAIGKPGQANSPNGEKLNSGANQIAGVLVELGCVGKASHQFRIHDRAIVEAFPTSFLGVMLAEDETGPRAGRRSDTYYQHLTAGVGDGRLGELVRLLLPGRRITQILWQANGRRKGGRLTDVRNHDERAAVVCAITALLVAARRYIAVGEEKTGYIILPPLAQGGQPGMRDWAKNIIQRNTELHSELAGAMRP